MRRCLSCISAALLAGAIPAQADVVISTSPTQNMSCSNGVCAPTAHEAVLNVGDLESTLVSGNVKVTTTGSGVQATNIEVAAPLTWSSTNTLALDAYQSITIKKPVTLSGLSGLSIAVNDGGSGGFFSFAKKGQVTFANLSSVLTINGTAYTLVGDITTLANDIAADSAGDYALANSYDASNDGTYQDSPIPTHFSGLFEGLGNTISNLSLNGTGNTNNPVGLFAELASGNQPGGAVENISLESLSVAGSGPVVGALVGLNDGTIINAFASGSLISNFNKLGPDIGALVGSNFGTITRSGATGVVGNGQNWTIGGGLAGYNGGAISLSYADCTISGGASGSVGGLAGYNGGAIAQSYAMGSVTGNTGSDIGGLVGANASTIAQSYSTTRVSGDPKGGYKGGLIGIDYSSAGDNTYDYWDTSTSRIKNLGKGAGKPKNDPGITGLTTAQLQSGLPAGFDPKVWAENPKFNNGLPYVIANPPRK